MGRALYSKYSKALAILLLPLALAACSVEGDINDMTLRSVQLKAGTATGFLSSSSQAETTAGGYKVSSSSGHTTTGIYQQTTGGYKVYSTIQGNNVSESSVLVVQ
jgi:hypothetical protein